MSSQKSWTNESEYLEQFSLPQWNSPSKIEPLVIEIVKGVERFLGCSSLLVLVDIVHALEGRRSGSTNDPWLARVFPGASSRSHLASEGHRISWDVLECVTEILTWIVYPNSLGPSKDIKSIAKQVVECQESKSEFLGNLLELLTQGSAQELREYLAYIEEFESEIQKQGRTSPIEFNTPSEMVQYRFLDLLVREVLSTHDTQS